MSFSKLFLSIALILCIQSVFSAEQDIVGVWSNPNPAKHSNNEPATGDLCCIPKSITITKNADNSDWTAKYDYDGMFSSNPNNPCITLFVVSKAELGLYQRSIISNTYGTKLSIAGVANADPFRFTLVGSTLNIQLDSWYFIENQPTCNFTMQSYSSKNFFDISVLINSL